MSARYVGGLLPCHRSFHFGYTLTSRYLMSSYTLGFESRQGAVSRMEQGLRGDSEGFLLTLSSSANSSTRRSEDGHDHRSIQDLAEQPGDDYRARSAAG